MDNELDQREILKRHMLAMSDQQFRKYVAMWFADLDRIVTRLRLQLRTDGVKLAALIATPVSPMPYKVPWKPLM